MSCERTSRRPELLVTLARRGQISMCGQIQQALRLAIRERRLQPGTAVPSTRTFADDLGVSRGVVVGAYDQLIAEGYLVATPGSATRVTTLARAAAARPVGPEPAAFEIAFRPGHPDLGSFPREAWRRSSRIPLHAMAPDRLGYGDARGTPELRSALAEYLLRARGTIGSASDVIICTGCAQALGIAARVLRQEGVKRIALEDHCHPEIPRIIAGAGLPAVSVPVDDGGIDVDALEHTRAQAVLVSPAHQNPMGSVRTPPRRQQSLAWASADPGSSPRTSTTPSTGTIERRSARFRDSLPQRILYVGSASKILAPRDDVN